MCGINAVISGKDNKNGFFDLYESLYHLQHRGQDSFGISYLDHQLKIGTLKYNTLLSSTKLESQKLKPIQMGIGHVRYPTSGEVTINECQPFYLEGEYCNISLVHNGQIWITESLKEFFYCNHIIIPPDNTSDSIYLVCLLSYFLNKYEILTNDIIVSIVDEIQDLVQGSYNCICLIDNFGLICFKDQNSIRPLIYGEKKDNKSYIIASESVSITGIGYDMIDDIYGNDLLIFHKNKNQPLDKRILSSNSIFKPCIFEWIYLAREESTLYNVNVYHARLKLGEYLAQKIKDEIDISKIDYVVPVPDTSKPVALSVSKILNIPYYECITKNRYVNRTFIMNTQKERGKNIKRKLNVIREFIMNKNLLIIDDSIVRGNTMKHIVKLLKENGSNEIYVASSCPEIINKNVYGIDIPDKNELICHTLTNENICREFNVNHIIFQNLADLKKSIQYFNKNINDFEDSVFI